MKMPVIVKKENLLSDLRFAVVFGILTVCDGRVRAFAEREVTKAK